MDDQTDVACWKKVTSSYRRVEGLFLIFVAGLINVVVFSTVKLFPHLPVGQFTATIYFYTFLFLTAAYCFCHQKLTFKSKAHFLFFRIVFGGIGGFLKLWSLRTLNYGDAVALISLSSVFATLFSRIVWKEKINVFTLIALIMGLAGAVLVSQSPYIFTGEANHDSLTKERKDFDLVQLMMPLGAALILGVGFSFMRGIGSDIPAELIGAAVSGVSSLSGVISLLVIRQEYVCPTQVERACLVLGGLGMAFSLGLLNRGLAIEQSGPGLLAKKLDIVTAYTIQVLFFGVVPTVLSGTGVMLILVGTLVVSTNRFICTNSHMF